MTETSEAFPSEAAPASQVRGTTGLEQQTIMRQDLVKPAEGSSGAEDGSPVSPSQSTILAMAAACAFAAATIYYNQPLLPQMAREFGRGGATMGVVGPLTQLGYAAGLFLIVPLGDGADRIRLILKLLAVNITGLVAIALAPSFAFVALASFVVGGSAVTAQIVIPAVSGMAAPSHRGRVLGSLVSGLSAGQLFARALSGVVGAHGGWRVMFLLAAGIDVVLATIVMLRMPATRGKSRLRYAELLISVVDFLRREPRLRLACASGFLVFGAFSSLWATLPELLSRPPYGWGPGATGALGFVGMAGLISSPLLGRASDRFGSRTVLCLGIFLLIGAFLLVAHAHASVLYLVAAAVMTDLGNRAALVANQNAISVIDPDARSRLNTAFMTSYFFGGAIGAMFATALVGIFGWWGLSLAGGLFGLAALIINLRSRV